MCYVEKPARPRTGRTRSPRSVMGPQTLRVGGDAKWRGRIRYEQHRVPGACRGLMQCLARSQPQETLACAGDAEGEG
jgi:hypothetical protein